MYIPDKVHPVTYVYLPCSSSCLSILYLTMIALDITAIIRKICISSSIFYMLICNAIVSVQNHVNAYMLCHSLHYVKHFVVSFL